MKIRYITKKIILLLCIFLLGLVLTACSQQGEPVVSNESNNIQATQVDIDWQKLTSTYNPPSITGLIQAIKNSDTKEGKVEINPQIKREFNHMGEDYRFFFMPNVTWYNFTTKDDYGHEGRGSTGDAIAYILFTWTGEFGTFPEKVPKYEVEARIRKIFAALDNKYPTLTHQEYFKSVQFDGESYSLWPESYNPDTMVYDLVYLSVRQEGNYTYYTASANQYGFDLTDSGYEPGKNEIFLSNKAKELGLDKKTTLTKLLETGEIAQASVSNGYGSYTIEFRVEKDNTVPQLVSLKKV